MMDVNKAVNSGIERIINDFQQHPHYYFTEEDVRWRLLREIENTLAIDGSNQIPFCGGVTSIIHTEYPTPFRCSMRERRFELLDLADTKGQRGHFDVVILNAAAAAECDFEVLRSQYYKTLCARLRVGGLPLPFLECVIELKLFRDLAHPNRTESARQQAEYAVQAVRKVAATLESTQYYSHPFANQGLVLLFDNSDLVYRGDVEVARRTFQERFRELIDWDSTPYTLSCFLVTPKYSEDYRGKKPSL
jgi:hypothetical protein